MFGAAAAVAGLALLLPGFRRLAAVELLFENDVFFGAGVVAGLVWANVAPASYRATIEPLRFAVNDVLMTFFFAIATKEVFEALLPGGPLASPRRAAMPLVATVGGMAGPAIIYLALARFLGKPHLAHGWAIPTATDIAFSAVVARGIFGARHPAIPFLLLLAIADDAGGLAILAIAYPQGEVKPLLLISLVGGGVVLGLLLRRVLRVTSPWPYLVLGGVPAWIGMHEGGLHPALSLVPIVPTLPHAARGDEPFSPGEVAREDALQKLENALSAPVALVLGVFALVNAGVPLGATGPATWLVLAGLCLGKPIGISLAVALGRLGGLEMPEGLRARDVVVLGSAAGIGFTVALFVATVAFERSPGVDLDQAKMGALLSIGSAAIAFALARAVRLERKP